MAIVLILGICFILLLIVFASGEDDTDEMP